MLSTLPSPAASELPPLSGLNDKARVDLTRQEFLAIDPPGPYEVDDAIYVHRERRTGNFLVQVAVADGAQLAQPGVLQRAISRGENIYASQRLIQRILPHGLVKKLELRNAEIYRALVISTRYDADAELIPESTELLPAWVRVRDMTYAQFGEDFLSSWRWRLREHPTVAFHGAYRRRRADESGKLDGVRTEKGAMYLVSTHMAVANMAVSRWAAANGVRILHRNFPPMGDEAVVMRRDEQGRLVPCAWYSPRLVGHSGILGAFGQDATPYSHTTSPLRRAADLINHIQLGNVLAGKEVPYSERALESIGSHLNAVVRQDAA